MIVKELCWQPVKSQTCWPSGRMLWWSISQQSHSTDQAKKRSLRANTWTNPTRGTEPYRPHTRILERQARTGPIGSFVDGLKKERGMYCNYCGKVIQDDAHLCAYCGKRVSGGIARKRLVRPRSGRKRAGVCAGFAEYFDLDVALVQIVWLVCSLFGLLGVVAYAAAWIVVPEEPLALAAPQAEPTKVARICNAGWGAHELLSGHKLPGLLQHLFRSA